MCEISWIFQSKLTKRRDDVSTHVFLHDLEKMYFLIAVMYDIWLFKQVF